MWSEYIGEPVKIDLFEDKIGAVEYISHMGSDLSVVNAARVSFGAEKSEIDEKDVKLINYLMSHNHSSPFEHCVITYRFTVPLFIRSQHHRHRTWSYNEISRRYTDVDLNFYEPNSFRTQHKSNRQASNQEEMIDPYLGSEPQKTLVPSGRLTASGMVKAHNRGSLSLFTQLLEAGVCREQARGVLPQSLYTQYYGTVNLHNLLKFVSLRTHTGAQWEIQQVASACLKIAEPLFPCSVGSFMKQRKEH